MALIWTRQLSVGNETIDSEHKNLIGMVNSIEHAINTRDCTALLRGLKQLMEWTQAHFANEEQFAQSINLPFDQHTLAHQHLLKELLQTVNELEAKRGIWTEYVMEHYPQFLREWLLEHITNEDMLMKPALQTYPYDFKPA
ncbi:MAG: hemerythrin family protein [Gallionella sp.]|nr:hemerythrin family protein [Gallionella sp.]